MSSGRPFEASHPGGEWAVGAEHCPSCPSALNDDGSCDTCDTAACTECGAVGPAGGMTPFTLGSGKLGRACRECASEDAGPSDGVPVAVDEGEASGGLTTRTEYEPIGADGLGEVFARRERDARKAAA